MYAASPPSRKASSLLGNDRCRLLLSRARSAAARSVGRAATSGQVDGLIQINALAALLHLKCSKATARMPSRFQHHFRETEYVGP
ncbi:hypothetical protein ABIA95_002595 [Bradyrhizobium sp. LA8.1]